MEPSGKEKRSIIAAIGLATLAVLLVAMQLNHSLGYVKFKLVLYDDEGRPITNALGMPTVPEGIRLYAQVYAIAPPGHDEVMVEIYKGWVSGLTLTLEARDTLRWIAGEWARLETGRGIEPGYTATSLELNLWVVHEETGSVIQRVSYFYPYDPHRLLEGESWEYTVKVMLPPVENSAPGPRSSQIEPRPGCIMYYTWRINSTTTPEAGSTTFSTDTRRFDNILYIKTPILLVYNKLPISGRIGSAIGLGMGGVTEFKASVGIGPGIYVKLRSGDATGGLSGKVYLGGVSRSLSVSSFWSPGSVEGGEWAYVWIWTRPVMVFYNEYLTLDCEGDVVESYTGVDKVVFFVQDAMTLYKGVADGRKLYSLLGGESRGGPPWHVRWLFDDNLSSYRYVIGLKPGVGHSFGLILSMVDECKADFEVPLGLAAASLLSTVGMHEFARLAVLMPPSMSYGSSAAVYVDGGVQNKGPVYEYLYLRVSNMLYSKDPPWWPSDTCYYQVPVAMYIESR
ncbi:MAG: hypothetical protein GSR84_04285 [Desulfurococcales archaeon]|nr:hypothetical protein [Desulfurococcales archaeon]